jgi:hypothetical protein
LIGYHTGKKGNRSKAQVTCNHPGRPVFFSGKIAKIIRFPYGRKNGKFSFYQKIPIFGATNRPGTVVI